MRRWTERIEAGERLSVEEAEAAFRRLMGSDGDDAEAASFLLALRSRGETAAELAGGVRALRAAMVPAPVAGDDLVDTCGTGGGRVSTFNISTAAGLVAAAAGARVAKHGNRSHTSRSGSADLLEALGVRIDLPPARLPEVLDQAGFVFFFAPRHHPLMRRLAPVRRELGVPTVLNLLGPLANPAGVRRQVVGVADPARLDLVADALVHLGHLRVMVVHGEPGLDELSPCGPSRVAVRADGKRERWEVHPEALGVEAAPARELAGGSPTENARMVERVLRGGASGAPRAAVTMNAGAALWAAGVVDTLEAGVGRAEAALDEGAAVGTLERLRRATARAAAQ